MRFHTAFRYASKIDDKDAALFARSMGAVTGQRDPERWTLPAPTGRNFHRLALELLDTDWILAAAPAQQRLPYPATTYLPSVGVLCAREVHGSSDGLFLAVKGGDNGVSHNHNDAGSFTVFSRGLPVIIDIGVETYRQETFDRDKRYTIWTMRSSFHNVPYINGTEQQPGHDCAATALESWGTETGGTPAGKTGLSMNLEHAYGNVVGLQSWTRSAQLDRTQAGIMIDDSWQGTDIAPELVLMLAEKPHVISATSVSVNGTDINHSAGWKACFERIDVTDARLMPVWGSAIYRAVIRPDSGRQDSGKHLLTVSAPTPGE